MAQQQTLPRRAPKKQVHKAVSKKRKFVKDGVFYAELNDFLANELSEQGYAGCEVRVTPQRTEIIIRATNSGDVIGNNGRRIRELTALIQKRFKFRRNGLICFAEKVRNKGFSALTQAQAVKYRLLTGLTVRRAAYSCLKYIMDSEKKNGALGCEIIVSGKLRGQRAKGMKFRDGFMIHAGDAANYYIDTAVKHVHLPQGVIGIKVKIMKPYDPNGRDGVAMELPDKIQVLEPKDDTDDQARRMGQQGGNGMQGGAISRPPQPPQGGAGGAGGPTPGGGTGGATGGAQPQQPEAPQRPVPPQGTQFEMNDGGFGSGGGAVARGGPTNAAPQDAAPQQEDAPANDMAQFGGNQGQATEQASGQQYGTQPVQGQEFSQQQYNAPNAQNTFDQYGQSGQGQAPAAPATGAPSGQYAQGQGPRYDQYGNPVQQQQQQQQAQQYTQQFGGQQQQSGQPQQQQYSQQRQQYFDNNTNQNFRNY